MSETSYERAQTERLRRSVVELVREFGGPAVKQAVEIAQRDTGGPEETPLPRA